MPVISLIIWKDIKRKILCPGFNLESSADCEWPRKISFLYRGMSSCETFVLILVQSKFKGLQGRAKWNWAILAQMFRVTGKAPHMRVVVCSVRIPTVVVISHMGVAEFVRMCVRPLLTRNPINSGVGFSHIGPAWCWLMLAANVICFHITLLRDIICLFVQRIWGFGMRQNSVPHSSRPTSDKRLHL